jgi:hypothetical protein
LKDEAAAAGQTEAKPPADAVIAALTKDMATAREQWRVKMLAYSRKPEGPLRPGESEVAGGPYHPILPAILALCIASGDAGDKGRFAKENVLKQTARYLRMLHEALSTAREDHSTQTLAAGFTTSESPTATAARWALDQAQKHAVEPFASDAMLTEVKHDLVETLKQGSGDKAKSRALFEYQVLISYWELLIEKRERQAAADAHRNDWWLQPTAKLAAFFSLVGTLPSPALVPARAIAGVIGIAQLLFLMDDTIARFASSAKREALEAVLAGDDERLAMSLVPNPVAWSLMGALVREVGLQTALNYAAPALGLAYDVYQDMSDLTSEQ